MVDATDERLIYLGSMDTNRAWFRPAAFGATLKP
jgi:hypothetical protein